MKKRDVLDYLYWGLFGWLVVLLMFALFACQTSPELQGELQSEIPAPIISETGPAVVFDNGADQMIITGFEWRQVYHLWLTNKDNGRAFTGCFYWQVYDRGVFVTSAECCLFSIGAGETKLVDVVMVPLCQGQPADACVLGIRVY
jgi:hypothetical protein